MAIIAICGASGIVGKRLQEHALDAGHTLRLLSHGASGVDQGLAAERNKASAAVTRFRFSPDRILANDQAAIKDALPGVEGADVVVCLSGASIGDGRLTQSRKDVILSSRINSVNALGKLVQQAKAKPTRWVQASAVGYYGNSGEAVCDEAAAPGRDFLAEVCVAWEKAAEAQRAALAPHAMTQVMARLGFVIDRDAPAWAKLVMPIKMFIGGPLGRGVQWQAWVEGHDVGRALVFLATQTQASGAFNVTSPQPARQIDIAQAAARKLGRPCSVPTPEFALRLALGEMADLLVLASCRASASKLQGAGFTFKSPALRETVDAHL